MGGSRLSKYTSGFVLIVLWLVFVVSSSLQAYGVIPRHVVWIGFVVVLTKQSSAKQVLSCDWKNWSRTLIFSIFGWNEAWRFYQVLKKGHSHYDEVVMKNHSSQRYNYEKNTINVTNISEWWIQVMFLNG